MSNNLILQSRATFADAEMERCDSRGAPSATMLWRCASESPHQQNWRQSLQAHAVGRNMRVSLLNRKCALKTNITPPTLIMKK
eukprot:4079191-Amphidinium_carterae.1